MVAANVFSQPFKSELRYIRFLEDNAVAGWNNKRKVMQRYDATAQGYDELYGREQKAKYMAALKNLNVAGNMILDVGCGSGMFFKEIAAKTKAVVGVDISRNLLLLAKKQARGFGNVFVVQSDADYLPFVDSSFNGVFAFTVLQNMPKPSVALAEWKRVAKKSGKVVVTALKKAIPLGTFMDLVEAAGFTVVSFLDDEALKCYVSALETSRFASDT